MVVSRNGREQKFLTRSLRGAVDRGEYRQAGRTPLNVTFVQHTKAF
jgi:hypothetical protein